MRRARHLHQKVERRKAILATALELLQELPYPHITMSLVAERADLVKGTLYLYFSTKEELFLELLRGQFHGWFWDLEAGLENLPRRGRLEAAARLFADAAASRPAFLQLLGVLHGLLEQNLPEASALSFQREWADRSLSVGRHLERELPFLAPGRGLPLLMQAHALIIGLQAMTGPSVLARPLLEPPGSPPGMQDFRQAFLQGIRACLAGHKAEHRRPAPPAPWAPILQP